MDVTDVLRARMVQPAGLQKMGVVSLLIHGALLAIVVLLPGAWFTQPAAEPRTAMTISLGGGTPGPDNGGLTTIGGRAVQAPKPVDTPREAVRTPAARTPDMTVPTPAAKPLRTP